MVSSCSLATSSGGLLLLAGLLAGCEVTSLDLQSPGTPADTATGPKADLSPAPHPGPGPHPARLAAADAGRGPQQRQPVGRPRLVRAGISFHRPGHRSLRPADRPVRRHTRELPPGGQDSYLRNKKLSGVAPGVYYIGSIVDVTHLVPEATETNNALAAPGSITLVSPPAER